MFLEKKKVKTLQNKEVMMERKDEISAMGTSRQVAENKEMEVCRKIGSTNQRVVYTLDCILQWNGHYSKENNCEYIVIKYAYYRETYDKNRHFSCTLDQFATHSNVNYKHEVWYDGLAIALSSTL